MIFCYATDEIFLLGRPGFCWVTPRTTGWRCPGVAGPTNQVHTMAIRLCVYESLIFYVRMSDDGEQERKTKHELSDGRCNRDGTMCSCIDYGFFLLEYFRVMLIMDCLDFFVEGF